MEGYLRGDVVEVICQTVDERMGQGSGEVGLWR